MVSEDGQALVEFALVLPFLLLFALALVLVSEIGIARLALEHAAAEGARIGSLTNDDEEIHRAVGAAVVPLDPTRVRTSVQPGEHDVPRSADPRGSLLRIVLEYPLAVPLSFAGLPAVTVRGSAVRVIEWTP